MAKKFQGKIGISIGGKFATIVGKPPFFCLNFCRNVGGNFWCKIGRTCWRKVFYANDGKNLGGNLTEKFGTFFVENLGAEFMRKFWWNILVENWQKDESVNE